jgi:hypothetical protein
VYTTRRPGLRVEHPYREGAGRPREGCDSARKVRQIWTQTIMQPTIRIMHKVRYHKVRPYLTHALTYLIMHDRKLDCISMDAHDHATYDRSGYMYSVRAAGRVGCVYQ